MSRETIEIVMQSRGSRVVQRDLRQVSRGATTAHNAVSTLRRALLTVGVGFSLLGVVNTLRTFSQEMATVRAITGATEDQFQALRNEARRLGAETRFGATQAAEGAQFLARAGFDTDQILASLNDTLVLAQAGATDLATAADIASNVLRGFRMSARETGRAVDVLAFAANRGNTSVQQLGDALRFVAPVASGLGVSLETTTSAVVALSDAGLQASIAGTGLRRVLSTLEAPNAAVERRLLDLGVRTDEVRVSQVGLIAALERLREAGVDAGLAMQLFGERGGPAFEVLREAIPQIRDMGDAMEDIDGFAREIARVMDDNLNGALLSVKSATEALIISFGDLGAENLLTRSMWALGDAIRFVANNLEDMFTLVLVNGPAFLYFFRVQLVAAMVAARRSVVLLGAAIAANPIGLLITAVSAAISLLFLFRDAIKLGGEQAASLGDIFRTLWEDVKVVVANLVDIFRVLWEDVRVVVTAITFILRDMFSPVIDAVIEFVRNFDLSMVGLLRATATSVDMIIGVFTGAFRAVVAVWSQLKVNFMAAINDALQPAASAFESFVNAQIRAANVLRQAVGLNLLEEISINIPGAEAEARNLGTVIGEGFRSGLGQTVAQDYLAGVLARAEIAARDRAFDRELAELADDPGVPTDPDRLPPSASGDGDRKKEAEELSRALSQLINRYDGVTSALMELAETEQTLNSAVAAGMISRERANELLGLAAEALRDQIDPLGALNREFEREAALLSMTASQRSISNEVRRIEQDMLSSGIRLTEDQTQAIGEQVAALQILQEQDQARTSMLDAIRGPQRRYNRDLTALNQLVAEGAITQDEYNRQLKELRNALPGASQELDNFAENMAKGIQSTMADFLFDPFQNGLEGMVQGFANAVQRMVAEAVAADLTRRLFGSAGGGSGSGLIGSALGAVGLFTGGGAAPIPGGFMTQVAFDGGGYTGNRPRVGGLDGKGGFLAMMHPQETVIDHTREDSVGTRGSQTVNNTFILQERKDTRTQQQIAMDAAAAQRRANARFGA